MLLPPSMPFRFFVAIVFALFASLAPAGDRLMKRFDPDCVERVAEVIEIVPKFWTKAKVIAGIQALYPYRETICILHKVISNDISLRTAEILTAELKAPITGRQLLYAGRIHFGSWPEAFDAAMKEEKLTYVDLEIFYGTRVWTKPRIISALKLLEAFGIDIGTTAMGHDRRVIPRLLLTQFFGRQIDGPNHVIEGQALYRAAQLAFGSYPQALREIGFDPARWQRRGIWSAETVIACIKALHKAKVPLNVFSILQDKSKNTVDIIERFAGFRSSGNALLQAAMRRFGSWDDALREADLDPAKIRRYRVTIPGRALRGQVEVVPLLEGEARLQRLNGKPAASPSDEAETAENLAALEKIVQKMPKSDQDLARQVLEVIISADHFTGPGEISRTIRKEFQTTVSAEDVRAILKFFEGYELAF